MTGSHEVRGSIPLGSTNHFSKLEPLNFLSARSLNLTAYTLIEIGIAFSYQRN